MEALSRVLDVLCMDFTGVPDTIESLFYSFGGIRIPKRPGRRRRKRAATEDGGGFGHSLFEPYVKMEVSDQPRTDTSYALRNVIKKKKYADEVQTLAEVSDSEKEDISDDEDSDEFDPEVIDVDEPDDEYDEGDDGGIEEDSSTDEEAELLMMEENMDFDDDLFDPDDDYKDVKPRFRKRRNQLMDPTLDPEGEEPDLITVYNVRITEEGMVEMFEPGDKVLGENGAEEEEDEVGGGAAGESAIKLKTEEPAATGELARVVAIYDDVDKLQFKGLELPLSACEKVPAKMLMKPIGNRPVSLLFCSASEQAFSSLKELKHHVAKEYPGSRFFTLPKDNPHRNSAPTIAMLQSYENLIKMDPDVELADVVFPCPHCRRRFVGHLGGLANHLSNDHRHAVETQLHNDVHYYDVFLKSDPKVAICEFCGMDCGTVEALNKHLISCPDNTSGHSAGLFCSICGKMFTQTKNLKGHLIRHGRDKLGRPRDKYCSYCPVACTTDAALQRHMDREHDDQNPDEGFVLHASKENSETKPIPLYRLIVIGISICYRLPAVRGAVELVHVEQDAVAQELDPDAAPGLQVPALLHRAVRPRQARAPLHLQPRQPLPHRPAGQRLHHGRPRRLPLQGALQEGPRPAQVRVLRPPELRPLQPQRPPQRLQEEHRPLQARLHVRHLRLHRRHRPAPPRPPRHPQRPQTVRVSTNKSNPRLFFPRHSFPPSFVALTVGAKCKSAGAWSEEDTI